MNRKVKILCIIVKESLLIIFEETWAGKVFHVADQVRKEVALNDLESRIHHKECQYEIKDTKKDVEKSTPAEAPFEDFISLITNTLIYYIEVCLPVILGQKPSLPRQNAFYKHLKGLGFDGKFMSSNDFRTGGDLFPCEGLENNRSVSATVGMFHRWTPNEQIYLTVIIRQPPLKHCDRVPNKAVRIQFKAVGEGTNSYSGEATFEQYVRQHPDARRLIGLIGPLSKRGRCLGRPFEVIG